MRLAYAVIAVCWLAFYAAWGLLAIWFRRGSGRRYPGVAIGVLVVVVALILGYRVFKRMPVPPSGAGTAAWLAAGATLCVLGVAYAIWARFALGRNWGMPMAVHEDPELVTSGPYRYVRHPIYTGLTAMLAGATLVLPPVAPAAVLVTVYCVVSAIREERDMQRRFPEAYPAYRRRSKMFLPFLI